MLSLECLLMAMGQCNRIFDLLMTPNPDPRGQIDFRFVLKDTDRKEHFKVANTKKVFWEDECVNLRHFGCIQRAPARSMESHNIHRDDNCENLSRMASLKDLKL